MAERKWIDDVCIENAELLPGQFKNFSGRESQFNRAGDRNFAVFIDDKEVAQRMIDDGWNVKIRQPRDEDEEPRYYIIVAVSFKVRPPKITLITGRKQQQLTEENVGILDDAEAKNVDLILHPYLWGPLPDGKSGVKAYLKEMYFEQRVSPLGEKYAYLDIEVDDEE